MCSRSDFIDPAWKNDLEFLKRVSKLSGMAVTIWSSEESGLDLRWTSSETGEHPCFTSTDFRLKVQAVCRSDRPRLFSDNNLVFYGFFQISSFYIVLGPAVVNEVSRDYLARYSKERGMESPVTAARLDMDTVLKFTELVYYHVTGAAAPMESQVYNGRSGDWSPRGALEEYQLDQSENGRNHQSGIDFEHELLRAISDGDPDRLDGMFLGKTVDMDAIGCFTDEWSKQQEYLIVALIALATRAAIAGGVRPEEAHEMGDVYLRLLARASAAGKPFMDLGYKAMLDFAQMSRQAKESKSGVPYVEACKDFIEKNLRGSLEVADIAPAIGVSRSYISQLFHETEGITLQKYVSRERCRHAARMLVYSDRSVADIAQYFGFSSQSYFAASFRIWYGMTPAEYRKENKKI